METVPTSATALQDVASVDDFLNVPATETAPQLFRGFLHRYYKSIYNTRSVTRELRITLTWLSCGFEQQPSRDTVDWFPTNLELVVDDGFDRLVE